MPSATNGAVTISYEVTGRGRPLVLLHGWLNDRSWWSESGYVEELGRDHRLISAGMRGHGRSDKPRDPGAYPAPPARQRPRASSPGIPSRVHSLAKPSRSSTPA